MCRLWNGFRVHLNVNLNRDYHLYGVNFEIQLPQNFHKWHLRHFPPFAGLLIVYSIHSIQRLNVHRNCLFISFLVLFEISDLKMKRLLTRSETGKWVLYILRLSNYHPGIINFVFEVCPMELTRSCLNIFSQKDLKKKGSHPQELNQLATRKFT